MNTPTDIQQKFEVEAKKQGFSLTRAQQFVAVSLFATISTMPAFADTVDISPVVSIITGFVATVSAVGLAVLSLVVTGKVFKWVRTVI